MDDHRRRRERPRGAGYRIGGTVLVLVGAIVASGIVYGVVAASGAGATSSGVVAAVTMALAIAVLAVMLREGLPAHEQRIMVRPRCGWGTTLGVALGVALAARLVIGLITVIGEQIDPSLCRKLAELDLDPTPLMWQKLAIALSLVVLAPLGEELLFRGILLRGFVRLMPFAAAAVSSGLLFGATHVQYWSTWPVLVGVGLFGIANGYVYRRFGYRTAVVTHALFNAVAAVFLFVELPQDEPACP